MSQVHENKSLFTPDVATEIRRLVAQFGGNEVFMVGTSEPDGLITFVEPMAFGNRNSVPAPAQAATPGQVLIHNHPSGRLDPSDADISIASVYGKAGIGFYIVNNDCTDVRVVVKPFFPKAAEPIDFSDIENLFGRDGRLSQSFPGFEFRPQQLSMMRVVTEAFNSNKIAVVEAGTGVGKSFAYLAPSILWALKNKRRVVISTNTIILQEQLLHKDLPELARQLNLEFKAVLVKGRGNYISYRRLKYAGTRADLFHEDRSGELQSLAQWAEISRDGSRSDLPFSISEDTWEAVMSDKDDCLRAECQFFNQCHYYNSRREAANADIIVANHHLVMADVALRLENSGNEFVGILPPFDRVIFDEAHNLEEVATSYFTTQTSLAAIRRQFFRLARLRDRSGVLQAFYNALRKNKNAYLNPTVPEILSLISDRIIPAREEAEIAIRQFFDELFAETSTYFYADNLKDNDRREFRITVAVTESPYWTRASELMSSVAAELQRLIEHFASLENMLSRLPEDLLNESMEPRLRLFATVKKITDHHGAIGYFLAAEKEEYCRWFELGYRRGQPYIVPHTAPLDISKNLRDALFSRKNTVVLTSATLTIDNTFNYFNRQMGLSDRKPPKDEGPDRASNSSLAERTTYLQLDTPFDYEQNCIIGIPRDLPVPASPDFLESVIAPVIETIKITRGRALVLFTAYSHLRRVLDRCRTALEQAGITPLMQGEMPRHQLVENFKSREKAALFATSSFWEGVDIQGDALQSLVIIKLPFSVPSTPIIEARAEMLDRQGGNSFYEIAIPQAVIKFKQGFGRLIRSHRDHGVVLILDNRVLTQRYGRIFMRSLPPAPVKDGTTIEVLQAFNGFIGSKTPSNNNTNVL